MKAVRRGEAEIGMSTLVEEIRQSNTHWQVLHKIQDRNRGFETLQQIASSQIAVAKQSPTGCHINPGSLEIENR